MTIMKTALITTTILTFALPLRAEEANLCEQGKAQSPVTLTKAQKEKLPDLAPDYKEVELTVERTPGFYALYYPEGSTLTIGEAAYNLSRITFHTPAEHILRGQKFDLEVQLEHKAENGKMAIVSIMMKKGFNNYGLNTVIQKMPAQSTEGTHIIEGVFFSPQTLFPADLSYYTYTGSLTTPPCTEDVQWYVLKSYVELGQDQLAAFKKVLGNNARAVHPLHNRKILQN